MPCCSTRWLMWSHGTIGGGSWRSVARLVLAAATSSRTSTPASGTTASRTTDLYVAARAFAVQIGVPVDLVVHRMDGWPDDVCRVAAEYADGLQLDLVLMPADGRPGLPDRSIAVVDKDQRLDRRDHTAPSPPARRSTWHTSGWCSDGGRSPPPTSTCAAARCSKQYRPSTKPAPTPCGCGPLDAVCPTPPSASPACSTSRRSSCLRISSRPTPYPPAWTTVAAANRATADLLAAASASASAALDADVSSPLASAVRGRLA